MGLKVKKTIKGIRNSMKPLHVGIDTDELEERLSDLSDEIDRMKAERDQGDFETVWDVWEFAEFLDEMFDNVPQYTYAEMPIPVARKRNKIVEVKFEDAEKIFPKDEYDIVIE